jgi:hypothetical protein
LVQQLNDIIKNWHTLITHYYFKENGQGMVSSPFLEEYTSKPVWIWEQGHSGQTQILATMSTPFTAVP